MRLSLLTLTVRSPLDLLATPFVLSLFVRGDALRALKIATTALPNLGRPQNAQALAAGAAVAGGEYVEKLAQLRLHNDTTRA